MVCARRLPRARRWWLAAVALSLAASCKATSGVEVKSFDLIGVHAFKSKDILNVLATHASSWVPLSPKQYFSRPDFEADLKRIQAFYIDHGYPNVKVTDTKVTLSPTQDAVSLTVTIDEGAPTIVDDVRYSGFDVLPAAARAPLDAMPLKPGSVRDHEAVKSTRDMATRMFNNNGYPQAYIDAAERPVAGTPNHIIVIFRADPGPLMTFGEATVDGLSSVSESVVRREFAFKTGATFRQSELIRTQHRLARLSVFSVASVTPRTEEAVNDQVPIRVTVSEGKPRQLKMGLGYGSEEHARATVDWRHANFLGGARTFEVEGKGSSIDRGVKVNVVEPYIFAPGFELAITGTVWDTHQLTYDSRTYGGRATLSYRHETRLGSGRPIVRYGFHSAYVHEYLSYGVQPDALADQSNRGTLIAMGLNPTTGRGVGTLAALDFDVDRDVVDNTTDPHRGLGLTAHYEHAAPWLHGTYRFDEVGLDVRGYLPVGSTVVAGRAHLGSIVAGPPATVPFSKLYFLGGALSERGWGRFEISPLDQDGNPIGGRTFAESSVEWRVPVTLKASIVGFLDAGDVTFGSWQFRGMTPRADIGAGVRYNTPIGLVRVDYGHQLNPILGLLVNGSPETRRWRIHFSIGQAF